MTGMMISRQIMGSIFSTLKSQPFYLNDAGNLKQPKQQQSGLPGLCVILNASTIESISSQIPCLKRVPFGFKSQDKRATNVMVLFLRQHLSHAREKGKYQAPSISTVSRLGEKSNQNQIDCGGNNSKILFREYFCYRKKPHH